MGFRVLGFGHRVPGLGSIEIVGTCPERLAGF